MRKGFTLVELSIVIVIIGLLIGGILSAQSMLSTARVNAQAMQLGQFDAGVMSFQARFRGLPGDAPSFGGNGDGIINTNRFCSGDPNACPKYVNTYACELAAFWNHTFPEKFAGITACAWTTSRAEINGSGKNVPAARMGEPGAFFIASGLGGQGGDLCQALLPQNYYAMLGKWQLKTQNSGYYQVMQTTNTTAAAKPADLAALDNKLDDGVANTGEVISGGITGGCGPGATGGIALNPHSECSNAGLYNFSTSGYSCTPLIRIGGAAGNYL